MASFLNLLQFAFYTIAILKSAECKPMQDKPLSVPNGWGIGYGDRQNCLAGSVAVGFRIKYDARQGNGDKTGLNAIELKCADQNSGGETGTITSDQGTEGTWSDAWFLCPSEAALRKFALDVRGKQHEVWGPADDTSVENIRFTCSGRGSSHGDVIGDSRGNFGEWSESCIGQTAICGMKTVIDLPLYALDKTGLNNVFFYCC